MNKEQRQQSLTAAREACKWLKKYFVGFHFEPFEREVVSLLKGFEILDTKEKTQIRAGKRFGKLGAQYGSKAPAPGKKRGRPKKEAK